MNRGDLVLLRRMGVVLLKVPLVSLNSGDEKQTIISKLVIWGGWKVHFFEEIYSGDLMNGPLHFLSRREMFILSLK